MARLTSRVPASHAAPRFTRRSVLESLGVIATLAALASCGPSSPSSPAPSNTPSPARDPSTPLRVVCTTAMVADVVTSIAGEHATVTTLMGAGVDPHLYRPTRTDVAAIMQADAVFYNGLLLEGKMSDTLVRAASGGRVVWPITELIPEDSLLTPDGAEGHHDPHVWMDPVSWRQTVEVVRDKLIDAVPSARAEFEASAARYESEIDRLHTYAGEALGSIPDNQRVLITSHDAFNYFGRRYNLEVVGIQGLSTESEAGVRDVERLVDLIVTRGIRAVFVETTVSDRNIRALIDGAAARGHTVVIGGSLYSDAMGPPATYEGTYLGMIDHNVTTVSRALGGNAPEHGMDNKLAP